ncbi:MAG TPA: BTAD domain-containing putative transcriptional regulator [Thermoanaerobaculia bacterium]|jgi:DNA-binding SARP family transcriptional activator|nr:BTAD domain-containing putative transcriptional regulator [Thermoanaerobaculia bacterium]
MESAAASPKTPRAEVRLLGGFEVRVDGRTASGFESQKVRGLLAYLAVSRGTFHGRERLAELFWPDHEPAAARSSLRQALYNLRSTLAQGTEWQPIEATHQAVSFSPGPEVWVDVEAFEEGLRRGQASSLDAAVQLYRGDFLSGCPVRAGEELDGWIAEQQERLREGAVQALRTLIAHHRERGGPGGHRLAIQHAQRLLALDPLSEEAHRELMSLYSLSGRRGRALSQYEDLRHRLDRDLGVEPSAETHALYRAILREEQVAGERGEGVEPVGPIIPLVGRDAELLALRRVWGAVQRGAGAFALLEGEPGAGKSRLAKSFLDEAETTAGAVLLARCQGFEPEVPYQPIRDALRNSVGEEMDAAGLALAGAPAELVGEIARLLPELGVSGLPTGPGQEAAARDRLADAVWQVLRRLTALSGRRSARPVLFLLEDLHLADRTTLGLLERLLPRLAAAPVMILATAATGWRAEAVDPLAHLRPGVKQIFLERLDDDSVRQVAGRLVGPAEAGNLARLFLRHAAGLPLAIAELTNLLADEGVLVRSAGGGWTAVSPLDRVKLAEDAPVREIILRRIGLLPTSTRRLVTLAAVLGHGFDAALLREVEREHATVVEHGIEVLLDRWIVRHATSEWHASRRESDKVLWANGARRGAFEFSHEIVRRTVYDSLSRSRRRILHRQVAEVLERRAGADRVDREAVCELLAYHYARAGAWDRTVAYLKMASDRALHLAVELPAAAFDQETRM